MGSDVSAARYQALLIPDGRFKVSNILEETGAEP